jgi:hypothetical protein
LHRSGWGNRVRHLTLAIGLYSLFLVATVFTADAALDVRRAMAPLLPLVILLASAACAHLLRTPAARMALFAGVAAIALAGVPATVQWIGESSRDGIGFGDRQWRESATVGFTRALPADTVVYTNLPEPVYLLTGRRARFLPAKFDPLSGTTIDRARVDAAVSEMARLAGEGHATAVYFTQDDLRRPTMLAGTDLAERCGLRRMLTFRDGVAYLAPVN